MRHSRDWQMLAYLAIAATVGIFQWNRATLHPILYAFGLFMAFSVAVISHNHNHSPIFRGRIPNLLVGYLISFFYGHPAFVWVPVHNRNHHRFVNAAGDLSITHRMTPSNNLFSLLTYPTMSSIVELRAVLPYLRELGAARNRWAYWSAVSQYGVFYGVMAGLLLLDWRKTLLFVVLPQQFSLFVIHLFNYIQHVGCDSQSPVNHSRNFTGPILNALLFNNGFHTVHHDRPSTHWSQTPRMHDVIAGRVDPSLNVTSLSGWMFKTYLLGRLAVVPGKARAETTAAASAIS